MSLQDIDHIRKVLALYGSRATNVKKTSSSLSSSVVMIDSDR